ncbi:5-formyltetrahydrofolate cyclo-ligase [Natronincola ferrireducens]|uniref:5-formyltetrahydrofolate cyclo-ligase n=1 Tax=Natronincola ferrireducens TaxID=393762 RepID=A0A1G9ITZ6_9FIRM|nr:5-formyltetrahydrofolate cyclo-ligase [Natronincola ferrireducens]SDL28545.1 5-formyltetrahydrofolate cyclo-ligase [Natronincola ferrireducens]
MKKHLRNQLLEKRDSLTESQILEKSSEVFRQLKDCPIYIKSQQVMLYLSFRSEVRTEDIIKDLFQQGKRVFIPLTLPKTRELIISELLDVEKDLEIGNFGVLEPKKEAIRPVDPSILDLIIVPGVGFDQRGYRVGYGGGYYDRFLPKLDPSVPTVAPAFEVQLIDNVPTDSYDFPVQYIVTEDQFIDCKMYR